MPTLLKCCECGAALGEWPGFPEVPSAEVQCPDRSYYSHVYDRLRGRCPGCGRRLPSPSLFASVMRVDVKSNPNWRRLKLAK